jgi:hypothetical protein
MCTSSTECKTVITTVLTVMSSMDPHMISETWDEFWLGLSKWVSISCGSATVGLRDAIEIVTLRCCGCYMFTIILKA